MILKKTLPYCLFIIACGVLLFSSVDAQLIQQEDLSGYYHFKVEHYLDKENALGDYYQIDQYGIKIYACAADKVKNQVEFEVDWKDLEVYQQLFQRTSSGEILNLLRLKKMSPELVSFGGFQKLKSNLHPDSIHPLKGLKIAIDPGHMAGSIKMGRIERKYIDFKQDSSGLNQHVQLVEGNLTFITANLLKQRLEEKGAIVILSRDSQNLSAFGIDYDQWFSKKFKQDLDSAFHRGGISQAEKDFLLNKAGQEDVFSHFFKDEDLKERARKINMFHPDLTLIIHFNVDEQNTGWKKPGTKNFNMAFVPGSFTKRELEKQSDRLEFLRLIITDDLENSICFSETVARRFEKQLNVPLAAEQDAVYLRKSCMLTDAPGVYARNLYLTRMIHGTLVYGETLYQDNVKECLLLSKKETCTDGTETSPRLKQVADAYFEGIMNYVKRIR